MTNIEIVLFLTGVTIVGFVSLGLQLRAAVERIKFSDEFLSKFRKVASSDRFSSEDYTWLTQKSVIMQGYAGFLGQFAYRPAFENYMIQNYPIIMNTIPKIRAGDVHSQDLFACEEAVVRYIGMMDEIRSDLLKQLFNPISCFTEGIGVIFSIPIRFLHWFNIVGESFTSAIFKSWIFRFFSGLAALVAFLSALMSLILGWEKITTILSTLFR